MKFTIFLWVVALVQVSAATHAQKVSLNVKNAALDEVLINLSQQSSYNFLYNSIMIKDAKPVSLTVSNRLLDDVLTECFKGQPLTFVINGNTVIIRKKDLKPATSLIALLNVSGTVSDSKGPLPGVSVKVKGSTLGTVTNTEGRFSIGLEDANSTLIFSYLGYTPQEVQLNGRIEIRVILQEQSATLSDVVVVGYGTQRKQDLTGSIVSISEKDIKSVAITSPDQALQGHAAGVQVVQNSSAPGGSTTIRIRGGNSIQGGNEPLYVIDGLPVYNDSGQSGANLNGLSSVDPNDIEAIQILKDASATAIYGSRGANGVVIITTKRGKAGNVKINFDTYYGTQELRKKYELLNATEFLTLVNEANTNEGIAPIYSPAQIAEIGTGTDWQNEIFRQAPLQNYSLSMNGGDDKTQFSISGNYFKQTGIVLNSDFGRGSLRVNLDRKISDKLKIGNSLALTRSLSNRVSTDGLLGAPGQVIANALQISPTVKVRAADGTYTLQNYTGGQLTDNPVALALESKNEISTNRLLGSIYGDYSVIEGLKLKVLFGLDGSLNKQQNYAPKSVLSGFQQGGLATIGNGQAFTWLNENTLTYSKTINELHSLTVLGGYTQQASRIETNSSASRNFINDNLSYNNLSAGSVNLTPSSSIGTWGLSSFLARVNYGYKNKYLLTATGRYDGSSRFGVNHRYGFFPSASVAWRMGEETFIKKLNFFDDLKLRLSYGLTGNQEGIGNYPSLSILGIQNYVVGNAVVNGIGPNQISNPDLKWESTAQSDLGFDVAMFNNRLSMSVDAYLKKTTDLLLSVTIPGSSGFTNALKNLGEVENRGVELSINTQNVKGKFEWNSNFNIAYNKNTILSIGGASQIFAGQSANIGQNISTTIIKVGEPLGSFYGYVTDGVFRTTDNILTSAQPTAKPGDRRYKDLNGDNKINDLDREILGYAQPNYVGGFTNNISFKGLDLSVFLQGVSGNNILNANKFELEYLTGSTNQSRDVLNRWTPTNQNTDIPRASTNRAANRISSRQIEDGSYLRLKNVSLGYNISKNLLSSVNIKSLKVYISAENMVTWTKYSGYDPEVNRFGQDNLSQGFDYGSYPASKTFLIGLNLGL